MNIVDLLPIFETQARGILSKTSGFIQQAGFTHSLTPARNCTYGCTYCYVPTMGIYGGLKPEDWTRWGQFTTVKQNAAELLRTEARPTQVIYCSPLVDPYQPAESRAQLMPELLEVLAEKAPAVFVIQTRGPTIVRDLQLLLRLARRTRLRVSFSLTTDQEEVRRLYEPLCEPVAERLAAVRELRDAGIEVYATLAPILPCDPERLAAMALESTICDVVGDPFHVRSVKRHGATTREAASRIARKHCQEKWFDPAFQEQVVQRIAAVVERAGRKFGVGQEAFGWLALRS